MKTQSTPPRLRPIQDFSQDLIVCLVNILSFRLLYRAKLREMKKKILLSLATLFLVITTGMCTTWTITNSGFAFTPDTIRIIYGDDVDFSLGSTHNAVEVSQSTWDANGNTELASGFSVPLGGGSVSADLLTVGTHWYVCSPHASIGMKGVIIVENATGVPENLPQVHVSFFPNPVFDMITIKSEEEMVGSPFTFMDLAGKQILTGRLSDESFSVDISSFETGIYLLQVGERRRQTFKVMKK